MVLDSKNKEFVHVGKGNDAVELGSCISYKQRHTLCRVTLTKGAPGSPGLPVTAAIFEKWDWGGHVWISQQGLMTALEVPDSVGGWKWWQNRKSNIEKMRNKFSLGNYCCRPAIPHRAADADASPERCLTFASISVGSLLVLALRSGCSTNKKSGLISDPEGSAAFRKLYNGMMAYVPQDMLAFGCLSFGQHHECSGSPPMSVHPTPYFHQLKTMFVKPVTFSAPIAQASQSSCVFTALCPVVNPLCPTVVLTLPTEGVLHRIPFAQGVWVHCLPIVEHILVLRRTSKYSLGVVALSSVVVVRALSERTSRSISASTPKPTLSTTLPSASTLASSV